MASVAPGRLLQGLCPRRYPIAIGEREASNTDSPKESQTDPCGTASPPMLIEKSNMLISPIFHGLVGLSLWRDRVA
jgi:hypothetical protein